MSPDDRSAPDDAWLSDPPVHDPRVADVLRATYTDADLERVRALLTELGVLRLEAMPSGLFPAVPEARAVTGYGSAWVRDNVQVANVAWELGDVPTAQANARALLGWFAVQAPRFDACIEGRADIADKMQRPHIRFDGLRLRELEEGWPHKQNDALGYALWYLSRAALAGLIPCDDATCAVLARFPRFFHVIAYWRDADSGHWEETPKLQTSSLGAVIAGLEALRKLATRQEQKSPGAGARWSGGLDLARLADHGRLSLRTLLPWESRGYEDERDRDVDAAQLFLVQPLRVVDQATGAQIVERVTRRLLGKWGVRRYQGDSYWMGDYTRTFDEQTRTSGFEDDVGSRDEHLQPGTEAQWCLFDPLLSTIHGWNYLRSRDPADKRRQVQHFNRALGQITGPDAPVAAGLCAEAYFLEDTRQPDRWIANEDTPLLWTQALLAQALLAMERSVGMDG